VPFVPAQLLPEVGEIPFGTLEDAKKVGAGEQKWLRKVGQGDRWVALL
jgi:hypothetical protein